MRETRLQARRAVFQGRRHATGRVQVFDELLGVLERFTEACLTLRHDPVFGLET